MNSHSGVSSLKPLHLPLPRRLVPRLQWILTSQSPKEFPPVSTGLDWSFSPVTFLGPSPSLPKDDWCFKVKCVAHSLPCWPVMSSASLMISLFLHHQDQWLRLMNEIGWANKNEFRVASLLFIWVWVFPVPSSTEVLCCGHFIVLQSSIGSAFYCYFFFGGTYIWKLIYLLFVAVQGFLWCK